MGNVIDTYKRKYKEEDQILFQAVINLKEGNEQSFEQVYKLSERYIYSIIYNIVHDNDKTADLMQDTYLQIYRKLHTLENVETFLVWAGRIATNKTLRFIQKNKNEVLLSEEERDFIFEKASDDKEEFLPEDILLNKEKQQKIYEIINNLSKEQKITIQYYYFEEMSVNEISEVMQCSPGTVKSRLNYARQQIKKAVLDTEKKDGIKLYSLSGLPLLWLLFRDELVSCKVPKSISTSTLKGVTGTIGITITGAGKNGIKGAVHKFFASIGGKVLSGAVFVTIGGILTLTQIPKTLFVTPHRITQYPQYDNKGELNREPDDSENPYVIDGKYIIVANNDWKKGVYTINGKEVLPVEFDDIEYSENTGGLFKVRNNYREAYYNKSGKMVCQTMSDEVSDVVGGIFYCIADDVYRVYSIKGQLITDSTFDRIGEMSNGMVVVKKGDKYGVLRNDGSQIAEFKYDEIYFGDGEFITLNESIESGIRRTVLDRSGNMVFTEDWTKNKYLPFEFNSGFYNGVAVLSGFEDFLNPLYIPVKADGTIIFNPVGTDYIGYSFDFYQNGCFSYFNDKYQKTVLFNANGKEITSGDYVRYVKDHFIIEDNSLYSLINLEGDTILSGYHKIQYRYNGKYYIGTDDYGYDLYKEDGSLLYNDAIDITSIGSEMFQCRSENGISIINGQYGTKFTLTSEESIISHYSDGYAIKLTEVREPLEDESYTRYEVIDKNGKVKYTIKTPKDYYMDKVRVLKRGVYYYEDKGMSYIKKF